MQGIGKVDSWAQFVNLVQDARTRSQAISNAKSVPASGRVGSTGRILNQVAAAASQRTSFAPPVARATLMDAPKAATKALGSFFDAYA
jgi:hypothetical protein